MISYIVKNLTDGNFPIFGRLPKLKFTAMKSTVSIQKNSEVTKIRYPESRIKNNLGYGIVMIGVGIFAVYINSISIFSYLWIFIGILQLGTSLYQKKHQYLTIERDRIVKHSLVPKSIALADIRRVRKFMNSYKIESKNSSILIEKDFIENDSLYKLNHFFDSLELKVEGAS